MEYNNEKGKVDTKVEDLDFRDLELEDIYSRIDSRIMELFYMSEDLVMIYDEEGSFRKPTHLISFEWDGTVYKRFGKLLVVAIDGAEMVPLNDQQLNNLKENLHYSEIPEYIN